MVFVVFAIYFMDRGELDVQSSGHQIFPQGKGNSRQSRKNGQQNNRGNRSGKWVPALSRPLPKASWDLGNPVNRLQKVSLSCYKEKST